MTNNKSVFLGYQPIESIDVDMNTQCHIRQNGEWKTVLVYKLIQDLLTKKDQEHKAELEVIKGEIDNVNEEEIETDDGTYILGNFIDKKKALSILDKHINK